MSKETFDLAVIGGGIVGAGIALDAAARGLSVALVEKKDFASGTSSRSSKLIHGGLRYLQHGEIGLVREALRERETLRRIAPHLCNLTAFVLPVYQRGKPSPLGGNKWMLGAGLWTYDKFAASKDCPPHRWISAREAAQLSPALDTIGLRGAFVYHDGVTDDSRLVIEIIKKAATRGAVIANYAEVTAFGGKSSSVTDLIGGGDFQLRAKVFVSATGVWTKAPLRVSKGIHLVFAAEKFAFCKAATLIPALDGKRFHFVVPWHGKILVGTTDTDYQGDLDSPRAEKDEADNLLEAVTRNFPSANLSEQDVIASFAGLRPLVAQGNKPSEKLSRRERIVVDGSGMISVFGGKLTTYRAMAERVVDLAARRLGGATAPCCTHSISLRDDARETEVTRIAAQSADLRLQLVKGLPYTAAEVVYAARHEMAMTVEDVIERRTRIAMLARDGGNQCRALVKKVLESENAA